MFRNYLKIAVRNIINQRAYSAINIFGLAVGLAACILVGLFIKQEFEYDKHFENSENVYRLTTEVSFPNRVNRGAETPGNVKTTLEGKLPEINEVSRVYISSDDLVTYRQNKFYEDNIIYADSTYFKIFKHKVVLGNENDFLRRLNTMVLTESMAQKYFGRENPIGKVLRLNNKHDFEIVGVIEDVPVNSHFSFDFVATYKSLYDTPVGGYIEQWGAYFGNYTYLSTAANIDVKLLEMKVTDEILSKLNLPESIKLKVPLQPIEDIHLYSSFDDEIEPTSSISNIIVLSSIAVFILILAGINFINLTTARAVKRSREIGVRKVLGAVKYQLIKQFLGESILISFIALLAALVLVEISWQGFEGLIGTNLQVNYLSDFGIILAVISGTLMIGVFAGLYPSFVLTHFQPVLVLKGSNFSKGKGKGSAALRKGLVFFQFSISIVLIVVTLMLNRQVDFMRNFDMGFEKEQTIILETPEKLRDKYETLKSELNSINGVIKSSACLGVPVSNSGFGTELQPERENTSNQISISVKMIDDDYQDIFNLELVAGRMLSELTSADFTAVTVVNEATVRKLGFSDPSEAIGNTYQIGLNNYEVQIVGVVKDFHYKSLHEEVKPLIFMVWPGQFQELAIKIQPVNVSNTLASIEEVWNEFYPEYPFVFRFLDEKIDELYKAEERSFRVITTFSIMAIFIACLGLLGLTFYTAEQKRKEIGIRKVLGASVAGIVKGVSMEFMNIVILSNIIAWPVSYYLVNKWLESFAYRAEIDYTVFVIAGAIALLISFLTIGYTVMRSAFSNPVNSLRYE